MLVKCQHPGVKCSHVSDDYVCSAVQAVDECLCEDLGEDCVVVVVVVPVHTWSALRAQW